MRSSVYDVNKIVRLKACAIYLLTMILIVGPQAWNQRNVPQQIYSARRYRALLHPQHAFQPAR